MKIREATIENLDSLNQLHYDFTAEEANEYDETMLADWVFSKRSMDYVKKSIESKKSYVLVLEDKENIFGFLFASYRKQPARKNGAIATVEMMYLAKEYRSKGIGREMLTMVKEWALKKGANKIEVAAFAKNRRVIDFYQSFGFVERIINFETKLK